MQSTQGGFFAHFTKVAISDGTYKPISCLVPGSKIKSAFGQIATVKYVLKVNVPNQMVYAPSANNREIGLTSHQPVKDDNNEWRYACEIWEPVDNIDQIVIIYNVVLDRGHTLFTINNNECVTLAHDFNCHINSPIYQPYFGTQRIVDDLRRLDTNEHDTGPNYIYIDDINELRFD